MPKKNAQVLENDTSSKKSHSLFTVLLSLITTGLLIFSLIGVGLFTCSTDVATRFLSESFSRSEGAGISQEQIVQAALATKEYTVEDNNRDFLYEQIEQIFGISDASLVLDAEVLGHLDDVFNVVSLTRSALIVDFFVLLLLFIALFLVAGRKTLGRVLIVASAGVLLLFLVLGLWCVMDFNGFFAALHSLFFAEGSWLFDANSLLIRMYPLDFWTGMGVVWLCTTLIACLICFILGKILRRK